MTAVLQEIVSILVGGIQGVAQGVGQGMQTLMTSIFLTGNGTENTPYALSVFGGVIIIFAGIALAIGSSDRSIKIGQYRWRSRTDNTEIIFNIA